MGQMLQEADVGVNSIPVAAENHLPLEDTRHEQLVLRKTKRRKSAEVKWIKWIGIIMDESLTFDKYWQACIDKARAMLGQLNGIGTSQWGISATSWRSIYTGMIRTVAMWGAELGWRCQKRWEQRVIDTQCQALSKCMNAVRRARKELMSEIVGVESLRKALDAAQARLLSKRMRDPTALGDMWSGPGNEVYPREAEEGTDWDGGRSWKDCSPQWEEVNDDGFTSVMCAILNKAAVIGEGAEGLGVGGKVEKGGDSRGETPSQ